MRLVSLRRMRLVSPRTLLRWHAQPAVVFDYDKDVEAARNTVSTWAKSIARMAEHRGPDRRCD
jgi:hypothetical protein